MYVTLDPELLNRRNVILSAPTGSGKTTATLKALGPLVLGGRWRRAVFAVPTLALAREVYQKAAAMYGRGNVGLATSEARVEEWWTPREFSKPILVTTYEVLDAMLLGNPLRLNDSIIVIDEVHKITDRTTTIQSILASAKYLEAELGGRIRVVALSATVTEAESLAEYLDAELVTGGERPVEIEYKVLTTEPVRRRGLAPYLNAKLAALNEYLSKLYREGLDLLRRAGGDTSRLEGLDLKRGMPALIAALREAEPRLTGGLRGEVRDWLGRFPILVYWPSRRVVEEIAEAYGGGATYHHAGRPSPEKAAIEAELRKPQPKWWLVAATDTLALGVNMAFGTVVVAGLKRFLRWGVEPVRPETIVQVAGRAGRPGYSRRGYAVIIAAPGEEGLVEEALSRRFQGVPEVRDYPGLVLRLKKLGYSLDVWAKYAYRVDSYRFTRSVEVLEELGLMEGGRLTPFAAAAASRYVSTDVLVPLLLWSEVRRERGGSWTSRDALYAVLAASSWTNRWWSFSRELHRKPGLLSKMDTRLASVIDNLAPDEEELESIGFRYDSYADGYVAEYDPAYKLYRLARLGGIEEAPSRPLPDSSYAVFVFNPALISLSTIEALVHSAKWLREASGLPLADGRTPVPPGLSGVFDAYARIFEAAKIGAKKLGHPLASQMLADLIGGVDEVARLDAAPRALVDGWLWHKMGRGATLADAIRLSVRLRAEKGGADATDAAPSQERRSRPAGGRGRRAATA